MRCIPFFLGTTVLLALFACTGDSAQNRGHGKAILPWEENGQYWAWEGKEPVLLLGAGTDDNLFQSPTFIEELGVLKDAGGNYVRCALHSRGKRDRAPFAVDSLARRFVFDEPDSIYWARLADLLEVAAGYNHVVQLEGWRGELYQRDSLATDGFARAFAEQVAAIAAGYSNILYAPLDDISPEDTLFSSEDWADKRGPFFTDDSRDQYGLEGQAHWRWLLERHGQTDYPRNAAALTGHGANPAVVDGTAQFNRALLAGHAAVRHAREPIGSGLSGVALSSIRTIRSIERTFKLWNLTPAPEIIVGEPGVAYPAKDSLNNYLVYLAGPGSVTVQLDTEDQRPIRVSVVGYLGTRRSELLTPPYGSTFTISTEDDRGAWLLMKKED
ncbi:hypothetical protein [Lewinella sp. 4G2]|uniref:hypothetical protein n=1 Tax=Lewinella sp. 4G2 TaxID=1803372 RepID=UPI0007B4D19F|nr:hypothetical protein [Lewinella sp. 4G2]OAV45666.1 hypothetical protein A3850_014700 [Lewinella sp. 4G2]